jgi:predicted anti-sigma-YlaC factor YlaD
MVTVSIWELSGAATGLAMVVTLFFGPAVGSIPVNELAMNFASQRVDDGYLKVLVVAEAVVAKVLRKHPGVRDCFNVAVELNSNPVSHWNAIFHIEEKRLHCHHLVRVCRALA